MEETDLTRLPEEAARGEPWTPLPPMPFLSEWARGHVSTDTHENQHLLWGFWNKVVPMAGEAITGQSYNH